MVSAGEVSQERVVASTPRNTTRNRSLGFRGNVINKSNDRSPRNFLQVVTSSQGKRKGRDKIVVVGNSMVQNID